MNPRACRSADRVYHVKRKKREVIYPTNLWSDGCWRVEEKKRERGEIYLPRQGLSSHHASESTEVSVIDLTNIVLALHSYYPLPSGGGEAKDLYLLFSHPIPIPRCWELAVKCTKLSRQIPDFFFLLSISYSWYRWTPVKTSHIISLHFYIASPIKLTGKKIITLSLTHLTFKRCTL